ncbi:MAG: hypothetical protein ACLU0V_05005 [Eggerthella lenta]
MLNRYGTDVAAVPAGLQHTIAAACRWAIGQAITTAAARAQARASCAGPRRGALGALNVA